MIRFLVIGTFLLKTITWKLSLKIKPMTTDGNLFENRCGLLINAHVAICFVLDHHHHHRRRHVCHMCKIIMDKPQGRFTRNASPIDRMTYTQSSEPNTRHTEIGSLWCESERNDCQSTGKYDQDHVN